MTNKEKYAKEIVEIVCNGSCVAVDKETERPVICSDFDCDKCIFCAKGNCRRKYLLKEWAESEYNEKPVVSKMDRAFLEYFIEKYKYIARDENGKLFVYETQPRKGEAYWIWICDSHLCLERHFNVDFPMVKWSDSEPWLIEDLKKLEVVDSYE